MTPRRGPPSADAGALTAPRVFTPRNGVRGNRDDDAGGARRVVVPRDGTPRASAERGNDGQLSGIRRTPPTTAPGSRSPRAASPRGETPREPSSRSGAARPQAERDDRAGRGRSSQVRPRTVTPGRGATGAGDLSSSAALPRKRRARGLARHHDAAAGEVLRQRPHVGGSAAAPRAGRRQRAAGPAGGRRRPQRPQRRRRGVTAQPVAPRHLAPRHLTAAGGAAQRVAARIGIPHPGPRSSVIPHPGHPPPVAAPAARGLDLAQQLRARLGGPPPLHHLTPVGVACCTARSATAPGPPRAACRPAVRAAA